MKVFIPICHNGAEYEDYEETILGVYSTLENAQSALMLECSSSEGAQKPYGIVQTEIDNPTFQIFVNNC